MLAVLLKVGPFTFKTISLFNLLTFLFTGFVLWKRAKEEHYNEASVFDAYLGSLFYGLIGGRIFFLLQNLDLKNFNFLSAINFVANPGLNYFFLFLIATLYLYFVANKNKWDAFQVLDIWSQALSLGMIFFYLGHFFNGSMLGNNTNLPWGIIFPGNLDRKHPIQLYFVILYFIMCLVMNWLEYHYRTFEWYRGGKKSAQTGFLISVFTISHAIIFFAFNFLRMPVLVFAGIKFDLIVYVILLVLGILMLLSRSRRSISLVSLLKCFTKKEKN